jgi:hypothetical protein
VFEGRAGACLTVLLLSFTRAFLCSVFLLVSVLRTVLSEGDELFRCVTVDLVLDGLFVLPFFKVAEPEGLVSFLTREAELFELLWLFLLSFTALLVRAELLLFCSSLSTRSSVFLLLLDRRWAKAGTAVAVTVATASRAAISFVFIVFMAFNFKFNN